MKYIFILSFIFQCFICSNSKKNFNNNFRIFVNNQIIYSFKEINYAKSIKNNNKVFCFLFLSEIKKTFNRKNIDLGNLLVIKIKNEDFIFFETYFPTINSPKGKFLMTEATFSNFKKVKKHFLESNNFINLNNFNEFFYKFFDELSKRITNIEIKELEKLNDEKIKKQIAYFFNPVSAYNDKYTTSSYTYYEKSSDVKANEEFEYFFPIILSEETIFPFLFDKEISDLFNKEKPKLFLKKLNEFLLNNNCKFNPKKAEGFRQFNMFTGNALSFFFSLFNKDLILNELFKDEKIGKFELSNQKPDLFLLLKIFGLKNIIFFKS